MLSKNFQISSEYTCVMLYFYMCVFSEAFFKALFKEITNKGSHMLINIMLMKKLYGFFPPNVGGFLNFDQN